MSNPSADLNKIQSSKIHHLFKILLTGGHTKDISTFISRELHNVTDWKKVRHLLEDVICSDFDEAQLTFIIKQFVENCALPDLEMKRLFRDSCVLHVACRKGFSGLVTFFISCGCDVTKRCWCHSLFPIFAAAESGDEGILDVLLKSGAYNAHEHEDTPLIQALQHHNNTAVFRKLLEAQRFNHASPIRGDSGRQNRALLVAAAEGNVNGLNVLLTKGHMDVNWQNKSGDSPLIVATISDKLEAIQFLLNFPECDCNLQNSEGYTALHVAPSSLTLKLLVDTGIDLDITDNLGQTALHCNVIDGEAESVRYLLQANCRTDIQDMAGRTPLFIAVQKSQLCIIKMLVLSGALYSVEGGFASKNMEAQQRYSKLHKSYYKKSLKDHARVEIRSILQRHTSRTLKNKRVLQTFSSQLDRLNLPSTLKDFLKMIDLDMLS